MSKKNPCFEKPFHYQLRILLTVLYTTSFTCICQAQKTYFYTKECKEVLKTTDPLIYPDSLLVKGKILSYKNGYCGFFCVNGIMKFKIENTTNSLLDTVLITAPCLTIEPDMYLNTTLQFTIKKLKYTPYDCNHENICNNNNDLPIYSIEEKQVSTITNSLMKRRNMITFYYSKTCQGLPKETDPDLLPLSMTITGRVARYINGNTTYCRGGIFELIASSPQKHKPDTLLVVAPKLSLTKNMDFSKELEINVSKLTSYEKDCWYQNFYDLCIPNIPIYKTDEQTISDITKALKSDHTFLK